MEMDSGVSVSAEKTEPASPLSNQVNEDTCSSKSQTCPDGSCGTADVAKARWTLLRQVMLASRECYNDLICFGAVYW